MKIDIDLNKYPKIIDNDKIEETIYYLLQIGYNQVFLNETNHLNNKLDLVYNKLHNDINNNQSIVDVNNNLNKLFGLSASSSKKGEISEQLIYEYIKNNYKDYCYDVKREIAHNADGELNSPSGLNALVEIKNYENNVNNDEVNKLKYDLQFNNINFGLFISIKSGIIGKKYIDYEHYYHNDEEYHIVYISKIYQDFTMFDAGILLIEKIFNISNNSSKEIKTLIHNNLEKQFEELNKIITRTTCLKDNFKQMEDNFKDSLNIFYTQLREFDYDIKEKVKEIWENIESDISEYELNGKDSKEDILSKFKKDKCFLILSRLFDVLEDYKIVIDKDVWNIVKDNIIIGNIKKLKDKVNINYDSIKFTINSKNIDKNLAILKKIL